MRSTVNKAFRLLLILAFWIGLWWVLALAVHREVLLPTPARVAVRLAALARTAEFWRTIGASILRIAAGFLAGVILGTATGILNAGIHVSEELLAPLLTVIKATPVASFIILARVWMGTNAIPVFIAFLMVFPILQSNVLAGIRSTPAALLEMAALYRVPRIRRVRALYLPAVLPYFSAGCRTAFGMAWKAGVAAEVISLPLRSIGRQLYFSKLNLETADVFAWTVTIILLSLLMEKLLFSVLQKLKKGGKSI